MPNLKKMRLNGAFHCNNCKKISTGVYCKYFYSSNLCNDKIEYLILSMINIGDQIRRPTYANIANRTLVEYFKMSECQDINDIKS